MMDMSQKDEKTVALNQISDIVDNLEESLDKVKGSENKMSAWYEQEKAVFDIKKVLHDAIRFEKFNNDDYVKFLKEYDDFFSKE